MTPQTTKCLLALPNSKSPTLAKIFSTYSQKYVEVCIETETSSFIEVCSKYKNDNVGLLISHPINRLLSAYNALSSSADSEQTFAQFYRDPVRINYYSKVLVGIDFSSLGFVAVTEELCKALLLMESWCDSCYNRIPYSELLSSDSYEALDASTINEISTLYKDDIRLYEHIKSLFQKKWDGYQKEIEIDIDPKKQLFIHLGPPKTGTSALQSWFNKSEKALHDKGIDYPPHKADRNGVSSGNFRYLISNTKDEKLYFDQDKAERNIRSFNYSGYSSLLLSSEHFFYYLPWLFTRFPRATYIFYIRHPIHEIESNYHQEVKRHRHKALFKLPSSVGFNKLVIVSNMARSFGVSIMFRYFDETTFEGGSLYKDFNSCIPNFISPPKQEKKLNTQFSVGALELMRRANHFAEDSTLSKLDLILQNFSEDKPSFSFISPKEVEALQRFSMDSAEKIAELDKQVDTNKIRLLVENFSQSPFYNRDKIQDELIDVVRFLKAKEPLLAHKLYKQSKKCDQTQSILELREALKFSIWPKILLEVKQLFSKK